MSLRLSFQAASWPALERRSADPSARGRLTRHNEHFARNRRKRSRR